MNKVKKLKKTILIEEMPDEEEDVPYDEEWDLRLQHAHEEVMSELQKLKVTRSWPQAKIFELYWMSSDTLDEVSKKIGISKSTTFISVKKIRKYLENTLDNPFK
jgi:DNA-directed RNA polymerase specialized sigma24 family protein